MGAPSAGAGDGVGGVGATPGAGGVGAGAAGGFAGGDGVVSPEVGAGATPVVVPAVSSLLPPPPQATAVTPAAQIRNSARKRSRAREDEAGEEAALSVEVMTAA
jgi:hypothetical protein